MFGAINFGGHAKYFAGTPGRTSGLCRFLSVVFCAVGFGVLVVVCVWLCGVLGTFFVEIWNFINLN